MKNPWLAFILSFLLPGAGLWYLGLLLWGFVNLLVVIAISFAFFFVLPEETFEHYRGTILAGCGGGSAGLALQIAKQRNAQKVK
jgi:hypothetical protein